MGNSTLLTCQNFVSQFYVFQVESQGKLIFLKSESEKN